MVFVSTIYIKYALIFHLFQLFFIVVHQVIQSLTPGFSFFDGRKIHRIERKTKLTFGLHEFIFQIPLFIDILTD